MLCLQTIKSPAGQFKITNFLFLKIFVPKSKASFCYDFKLNLSKHNNKIKQGTIRFGTTHNDITRRSNTSFYCTKKKIQFKNRAYESQQHTIQYLKNIVHPHQTVSGISLKQYSHSTLLKHQGPYTLPVDRRLLEQGLLHHNLLESCRRWVEEVFENHVQNCAVVHCNI